MSRGEVKAGTLRQQRVCSEGDQRGWKGPAEVN